MAGEAGAVPNEAIAKGANQLGTLGGGNHFIEIQYVQEVFDKGLAREFGLSRNQLVVMIHSGSRRFGYEVADQYMNVAAGHGVNAGRGKMLSYLPTGDKKGKAYVAAMSAAANFAYVNRHVMGLFSRTVWLELITAAGFESLAVPFEHSSYSDTGHEVFLGLRPEGPRGGGSR